MILQDSCNSRTSIAHWLVPQTPTTKAPVWAPGGQSVHTKILMILWTSCIYEVWVGLGACQLVGRCRWHVAKFFEGQLGFGLICSEDTLIVCNKVVVSASSHHRSPGSNTQKSLIQAAKQIPIGRYATVSQGTKLINWILWTLDKKAVGADAEYALVSIGGLGMSYMLASGWR